jgi:hypothetical protein
MNCRSISWLLAKNDLKLILAGHCFHCRAFLYNLFTRFSRSFLGNASSGRPPMLYFFPRFFKNHFDQPDPDCLVFPPAAALSASSSLQGAHRAPTTASPGTKVVRMTHPAATGEAGSRASQRFRRQ